MRFNGLIWKGQCFLHLYINIYMWSKYVHILWSCTVTHSVQHSLWETNRFSGSQEFPAFYRTWRFITAFTSAQHLPLSWARSIQSIPPHPTSWRFILILFSHLHLHLQSCSFLQVSPPKPCMQLSSPPCATCPGYLILHNLITHIIFGEEHRSFSSSLCSFLHFPVTSSLLGPNILLSTPFSNTFSLHTSLNVSKQVSHTY